MPGILLYLIILVSLAFLDFLWLSLLHKPFYSQYMGHLMAENVVWPAVIAFYLLYSLGILLLVVRPGLSLGLGLWSIVGWGAFFGLVAYGTYELTNQATLKGWSPVVVVVDMVWGAVLTGSVVLIAILINNYWL